MFDLFVVGCNFDFPYLTFLFRQLQYDFPLNILFLTNCKHYSASQFLFWFFGFYLIRFFLFLMILVCIILLHSVLHSFSLSLTFSLYLSMFLQLSISILNFAIAENLHYSPSIHYNDEKFWSQWFFLPNWNEFETQKSKNWNTIRYKFKNDNRLICSWHRSSMTLFRPIFTSALYFNLPLNVHQFFRFMSFWLMFGFCFCFYEYHEYAYDLFDCNVPQAYVTLRLN